ncbi:MAG: hypothetical protein GFH27_549409n32 [Chloroflexi bacterium AL-W]|nr:hypothetical protein [Chloroflexi bacterium AL-N1]NOK71367.1 hypothetical protein [Chloroflexi bacterium AL-N10]NOK78770.1 hypothetical protein [Chloroflexi bacterium AL-N5]NOK86140.1 hypothetical protein [Chloroflexi bacterium AL-W]NOK93093.1 hypothetical protein [Chloroflexi bacterium AL-N15]
MSYNVDEALDQVFTTGLVESDQHDILRQLDAELQQQIQARVMVLGTDASEPWVLGGEQAGGFGSMAHRFLTFYTKSLHREICDAQTAMLKQQYRTMLGGPNLREQTKALTPIVMSVIGAGASLMNPSIIAVLVAIWMLRVGLDHWCAAPQQTPLQLGD